MFEYSEQASPLAEDRYCDYQVVRLYEDILQILPAILAPVPPSLIGSISGDSGAAWGHRFSSWCERNADIMDDDDFWRIYEPAASLRHARFLDSLYLTPATSILIWSDQENVHIEWDNSEQMIDGACAWSAVKGHHRLPRKAFIDEIRSFHTRLMEQMSTRIEEIAAGALAPDIKLNFPGLVSEHAQRCNALDEALAQPHETQWLDVEEAIALICRDTGVT